MEKAPEGAFSWRADAPDVRPDEVRSGQPFNPLVARKASRPAVTLRPAAQELVLPQPVEAPERSEPRRASAGR